MEGTEECLAESRATGTAFMPSDRPFKFDEELIEELRCERDDDCCGVGSNCKEERCPCYLLVGNGERLDICQSADGLRCGFFEPRSEPLEVHSWHGSLEDAVRANRDFLRANSSET